MNAETSLVIAVCVLGTLVGVAVVALAALLLVFCCPNKSLQPRSWVAQRHRRTRADMELEQLAAATGNFISDSMLPGNRTGASENLGIRSPDPRRVPALRAPDDLSPSPPFVPGQGQPFRRTQPRSRQPSPKRGHFLTVLNTIMPHGSPPPPPGHMDSHDQNDLSDTIFSSKCYRKRASDRCEYERIPSTSPKSRLNCSVRPKTSKPRGNVKLIDGYPNSEPSSEEGEDVEKCKDFGHSYYKPGGYTSYCPQNVFREKHGRKNRSLRRESRSLYSRIPINENALESPNRSNKHVVGPKSTRRAPHLNGSNKTVCMEGNKGREAGRYLNRSHDEQLAASTDTTSHQACARGRDRRDRSPPLASSSRNTSQDRSTSISVRQENSHEERRTRGVESSNVVTGRSGLLPRRSLRAANRHKTVNTGRDTSKLTTSNGYAEVAAIQKASRVSGQRTRQSPSPRDSRDCFPPGNRSAAGTTDPTDYLQTTNGQLVPVSSLMRSGPSIQCAARDTPVCDGVSFRENNIASTDTRPTYIHANRDTPVMGTMTGHSSSTVITLPSLTGAQIINNNNNMEPSVLYHNSHHSSTQSLRPQSHLLEGSSTFAGSHSIHLNMMQTPAAHSSHVISLSDVEHQSPKATIRFRQQGYPTQPWSARGVQGTDKSTNKNGSLEATLSDTEEEDRPDDRQDPDSVPSSPPASNTSSSSSPGPAISLAIQQCVPVSKEVVTKTAPPTERLSFLDSRDLGDPTTASMSWDHLTPDPSPVFSGEADISSSQYTQFYRRKKRLLSGTGQADITLSGATTLDGLDFDDTFARNYELRPYKKLEIRGDTRVAANLNPAIDQEVAASETIGETCAQGLTQRALTDGGLLHSIHTEASVNCTSLLVTQGRQNVAVRPTNIINRFALKENAPRDSVTSVKSDESFSTPLLPFKNISGTNESCPKVPADYSEHQRKKIFPRGIDDSTPGDPVMYSKLIENHSLQSNVKP